MAITPATATIVKDKAEGLFSAGRFTEALATYDKIAEYGEKDPRVYLRMGDIARKIGNDSIAIERYEAAAESFIKLGFVIKAIAVCKVILNIDPSRQDIHERLAQLHGARPGAAAPRTTQTVTEASVEKEGPVVFVPEQAPEPEVMEADLELVKLPKTPLFSDFNEIEFLDVVRKVNAFDIQPGEYLFREGDAGDSIYVIAEGSVDVIGSARDGSKVPLARLTEGAIFGEVAFFLNSRRTTDVVAVTATTILELKKADLKETISNHPRVEEILFDFYKERVADKLMALCDIFRPMSAADRKEILSRVKLVRMLRGSVIMTEGERGETMYLIKLGSVSVWVKDKSGNEKKAADLSEGDFFGEIALATTKPRVATVRAETNVELVEFSRPLIKDVLARYPSVKDVLERVIKERVVDAFRIKERGDLI
ncbi:MAG: cyclic nucleotide-binding domain-containing protein [Deltaproteobacteria bacterium]